MPQDIQFADAARQQPPVILKLQMLDYSIGHEIILQSKRNPLVCLSFEEITKLSDAAQVRALHQAVLVCSRTWKENKKPHRWLTLWRWLIRNENYGLAVADFLNYRASGSSCPRVSDLQQKEQGRPMGSPLLSRLLNFVEMDYDHPLGVATWQYFSALEDDGRIHVENDHEKIIREEIAEIEEDIRREKAEAKGVK